MYEEIINDVQARLVEIAPRLRIRFVTVGLELRIATEYRGYTWRTRISSGLLLSPDPVAEIVAQQRKWIEHLDGITKKRN